MNKNKGKSSGNSYEPEENKQKKSESILKEQKQIFKEVTINLENTDYNIKQKKKRRKKRTGKAAKVILVTILIIFITFAGLFIKRMNENGWTLGGFVATILGHDSTTLANLSRINILVIGQSQNLTDTILVCSYDPKTQDVGMLSIPRDTFVGRNKKYATSSDNLRYVTVSSLTSHRFTSYVYVSPFLKTETVTALPSSPAIALRTVFVFFPYISSPLTWDILSPTIIPQASAELP